MKDFGVVLTMRPTNKTAAMVMAKGFEYQPDKKINTPHHWDAPQQVRPVPKNTQDLTGLRVGRLRVIGLLIDKPLWLVRCDCGKYEARRSKSLKNERNSGDRCEICRHHNYLMMADEFRRTGQNKIYGLHTDQKGAAK
ncbi:MAG: hypothetical protein VR70_05915 [Rhodospirillaceae bacterium BRH_c57]|nr:MAG: hypothetical protein VR70_05915 [Rhodospirillaceae bacterium BRH_c57]